MWNIYYKYKIIWKISKYKTVILKCNNIALYYCLYCIYDQINEGFVSIRDFFQKSLRNLSNLNGIVYLKIYCIFKMNP